jgi:hypothetical protein
VVVSESPDPDDESELSDVDPELLDVELPSRMTSRKIAVLGPGGSHPGVR